MNRLGLISLIMVAGCGRGRSLAANAEQSATANRADAELIPAEWTVAEDTAPNGDVLTTSLQLPAAREISGLVKDQSSRLLLRCLGGKVAVYIEAERDTTADSTDGTLIPIQLDSAPSCEGWSGTRRLSRAVQLELTAGFPLA